MNYDDRARQEQEIIENSREVKCLRSKVKKLELEVNRLRIENKELRHNIKNYYIDPHPLGMKG